jgi:hypothetical protein
VVPTGADDAISPQAVAEPVDSTTISPLLVSVAAEIPPSQIREPPGLTLKAFDTHDYGEYHYGNCLPSTGAVSPDHSRDLVRCDARNVFLCALCEVMRDASVVSRFGCSVSKIKDFYERYHGVPMVVPDHVPLLDFISGFPDLFQVERFKDGSAHVVLI